jgi:hypothetical protein
METLIARTERESTGLIDPVVDRRYIIDSAIRTGAQGAPFEQSDVDLALKNLFVAESDNKQHRWFDLTSATEFLRAHEEQNYKDNAKFEELIDLGAQIPEGKTMDDLRAVLKTSADLTENIIKIRWWLDNGTDALVNEYAGEDEQKRSEVIVGLSALSGFLSDYFTLMEMIQQESGSSHEHSENCSLDHKPSLPAIAEDSNEIVMEEELAEANEEGNPGFFQDEDFDDSDEISNLCFTIAQVAAEDRTFKSTLDIAFGVTSLIIKDFENWVGADFVSEDEDEEEDEEEDDDEEEAPELVE